MSAAKSFLLLMTIWYSHSCCPGLLGLESDDEPNLIYKPRGGADVSVRISQAEQLIPYLDFTKEICIFTFGLTGSPQGDASLSVTEALNAYTDCNVLIYDWSKLAASNTFVPLDYLVKVLAVVKKVGDLLGEALLKLGVPMENVVLIGHSLGCSVMGEAGNYVKSNSDQIVGLLWALDPSGALYNIGLLDPLKPDSATAVHAVHTDPNGLGTQRQVGTADTYANPAGSTGYTMQPGCTERADPTDLSNKTKRCNHDRAWKLFVVALRVLDGFIAQFAVSADAWRQGLGDPNKLFYLRLHPVAGASGKYNFRTTGVEPYYLGIEGSKPAP